MKRSASDRFSWFVCAAAACLLPLFLGASEHQQSATPGRSVADATTSKYFPQTSVHNLMPYMDEFLNSTDEPSLLTQAQDPTAVSYRFVALLVSGLCMRVIRFSLHPDGTATLVTFLGPFPKDPGAKVKADKVERSVSAQDAAKFLELVDGAGFWTMPTVKPPDPTPARYYTLDGAMWLFEGCRSGAYHVVYRGNPNASPFTDMVHFLGKDLAGLDEREIPSGMWPPLSLLPPNQSVAIQISGSVTADRPFALRVINRRSKPISFCVASAESVVPSLAWSVPAFDVQRPRPKKWGSVRWGSDIGSGFTPTELASEKAEEFRIKLPEPGRYRLRLYYLSRSLPDSRGVKVCPNLNELKGAKVVTSEEFEVLPK